MILLSCLRLAPWLVICILAGAGCGGRERASEEAAPVVRDLELPGLPNGRQVGEDLLFGGQPTREALIELAGRGYRTILDTREPGERGWDEQALVDSLGMVYVGIPMPNPIQGIDDGWVERLDAVLREGRRPMLLHCSSGNRVAGLWTVWMVERRGVPVDEALDLGARAGMTRIRPVVEAKLARP